jgi:hypothetical protein
MPNSVSDDILECLVHAADYRYRPQTPDDAHAQRNDHAMELHWLDLARSYVHADRFSHSLCATAPADRPFPRPVTIPCYRRQGRREVFDRRLAHGRIVRHASLYIATRRDRRRRLRTTARAVHRAALRRCATL